MGYDTYWNGELTIDPPLPPEKVARLRAWGDYKQHSNTNPDDDKERADGAPLAPLDWAADGIADDGTTWDIGESFRFYDWEDWLAYLFDPDRCDIFTGHTVTGELYWDGEESEDYGKVHFPGTGYVIRQGVIIYEGEERCPHDGRPMVREWIKTGEYKTDAGLTLPTGQHRWRHESTDDEAVPCAVPDAVFRVWCRVASADGSTLAYVPDATTAQQVAAIYPGARVDVPGRSGV